jgi:putative ABC transport system permease protein
MLFGEPPTEYFFVPHSQHYTGKMTLIARTSVPPESVAEAMRHEVARIDSELPVYGAKTMPVFLDRILAGPKSLAALATIFGLVALMMAAVGLYGVMSYSVAQRTREIGIRLALGAGAATVLRLVLLEGMILAGVGVVVGIVATTVVSGLLESILYGISSTDVLTYLTVSIFLVFVALVASYVPARKATKIDPMAALRIE